MNSQQYYTHKILCYYFNASSELQIIKLKQNQIINYEQIVFPKQRLLFEAFPNSFLEVYRKTFTGIDLVDKLRCQCLQVIEQETVANVQKIPAGDPVALISDRK